MAPEPRATLAFLVTQARIGKWDEVEKILTPDNITLDDVRWALTQGRHDCAATRRVAAYFLMTSDAVLEQAQMVQTQFWMIEESGRPIRAMLAIALYKRGFCTKSALEAFELGEVLELALRDSSLNKTATKYLRTA